MSRSVEPWMADHDDQAIPPRIKLRIFDRDKGRCCICTRKLGVGGEKFDFDHIVALANGGKHAEVNLQTLCTACHRSKTRVDVAEKSDIATTRKKHLGFVPKKRPMPGSRASRVKHHMDGRISWR